MGTKRLWLQIIAYLVYALVVFVVYLYLTFPYSLLQQYLTDSLAPEGMRLTMTQLGPAFPPGLRARNVRLQVESVASETPVVQLASLRVTPKWLSVVSGNPQARVEATLYRGRLQGLIGPLAAGEVAGWELYSTLTDVEMAQHPLLQREGESFLQGEVDGEVFVTIDRRGQLQTGEVQLQVQSFVFSGQVLNLPLRREIACDRIQGAMGLNTQQASNVTLTCMGNDLAIAAEGTVRWQQPLSASLHDLRWQVQSEEAYKTEINLLGSLVRQRANRRGELSFRTYGPLLRPRAGASRAG